MFFVCAQLLSHIQLFVTLWTAASQAPLSMELSKQEYWSGFPPTPLEDPPDTGIEPALPTSPTPQADYSLLSHWGSPNVCVFFPQLKNKQTWEVSVRSLYNMVAYLGGDRMHKVTYFTFLKKIFGCAGSPLLWGLFPTWSAWVSHCSDLYCCRARVLGCTGFSSWSTGFSSWTH